MLNATNDYTEKDEVLYQYRQLQANKFRKDCVQEAKKVGGIASQDIAVLAALGTLIVLVIVVACSIWL